MRFLLAALPGPFAEAVMATLIARGRPPSALLLPAPPGGADYLPLPPARRNTDLLAVPTAAVPPLREQAAAVGVPVSAIGRRALPQLRMLLAAHHAELLLVACWPWRLPLSWLQAVPQAALNLHPGPLPTLRSAAPLFWALRLGWAYTRVTLHQMDAQLDSGPIVGSAVLPLPAGSAGPTLDAAAGRLGAELWLDAGADMPTALANARPQPAQIAAWPSPSAADFVVPADWSVQRAYRFTAGTADWGQPFSYRNADGDLPFRRSFGVLTDAQQPPVHGRLLQFADGRLLID
jgi:methionyl-tRNA formyltransferase